MTAKLPSEENQNNKKNQEPFGDLIRSMQGFLNEKPVRGFLQQIDDFFRTPFPLAPGFQVETKETGKEYIVTAELPGVKREQIQLNVQGNLLTIAIDNQQLELEEDEVNQVFKHRQYRQLSSRTVSFPQPINEKKIKATYRDGLLEVRIPQNKGKIINIEG